MTEREVDRKIYENELSPWLPPKIIDGHVHIGLSEHIGPISDERKKSNWAYEVGLSQSWEELRSNLEMLFPKQEVETLVFGIPLREVDLERNNDYVLAGVRERSNRSNGLLVTRPEWEPSVIEQALQNGFLGIKPYPDLAPSGDPEPSIYEFLPEAHLELLNRQSAILMLHLPRKGRIADPENIRELTEISRRYPGIRIIVAHIGRAFCLPTTERALPRLTGLPNVWYDMSAVLNADVLAYAIRTIGPDRLLYGSDLPITLIRGYREHVGETYINYADGNFSWNTNRKPPEVEANYTYYIYEELRALIAAAERLGLGKELVEKVMYSNAARLLGGCTAP
ncbi:MAG: amidohydrolase family protein [Armatimonadota bacterium]